jgi:hypothetical protein
MACAKAFMLAAEKSVGWRIVLIGNCVTKGAPQMRAIYDLGAHKI